MEHKITKCSNKSRVSKHFKTPDKIFPQLFKPKFGKITSVKGAVCWI